MSEITFDPRDRLKETWRPTLFGQRGMAYERGGAWFVELQQLPPNPHWIKEVRIDSLDSSQDRCPLCGDALLNDMDCQDDDPCFCFPFCYGCDWSAIYSAGVPKDVFRCE